MSGGMKDEYKQSKQFAANERFSSVFQECVDQYSGGVSTFTMTEEIDYECKQRGQFAYKFSGGDMALIDQADVSSCSHLEIPSPTPVRPLCSPVADSIHLHACSTRRSQ